MRVSRAKAAENRDALLSAAGKLFREKGIDGVGVADIGKAAGLTHGALYAHFASKEALAAAALAKGTEHSVAAMRIAAQGQGEAPRFEGYLDFLFSAAMRDTMGCPLAASASEAGRQGTGVSASFTSGFEQMVAAVEASLSTTHPAEERRRLAIAVIAAQIGAIAVARAVGKTDSTLSDEVLAAVRRVLAEAEAA